jgi:hypothetical protein
VRLRDRAVNALALIALAVHRQPRGARRGADGPGRVRPPAPWVRRQRRVLVLAASIRTMAACDAE